MSIIETKAPDLHLLCSSRTPVALEAVRSKLGKGENPRLKGDEGLTPLHVAAAYDNLAISQLLLHYGADPLCKDDHGRTAIDIATGTTKIFLLRYIDKDPRSQRGILRKLFFCHCGQYHQRRRNSIIANIKSRVRQSIGLLISRRRSRMVSFHNSNKDASGNQHTESKELITKAAGDIATEVEHKPKTPRRRARTPDILQTPEPRCVRPRRSKTPDFDPSLGRPITTLTNKEPFATYKNGTGSPVRKLSPPKPSINAVSSVTPKTGVVPRARYFRAKPSAPPLALEEKQNAKKTEKTKNAQSDSSAYLTADESFHLHELEERLGQLKIAEPVTPTQINEEELKRIKKLKDSQLREQLRKHGIHAGPICSKTRRLYEKKLLTANEQAVKVQGFSYSKPLELAFKGKINEKKGKELDESIRGEFQHLGVTAFVYLLLDPRVLENVEKLTLRKVVEAIFYVGKGTKARPLAHLIDAKKMREISSPKLETNAKLNRINAIWKSGRGVGLLEISHTISDDEAFVREAAFFEAIRIENLTNIKGGEWRGKSRSWDSLTKSEFGVYLLKQAYEILKTMGPRYVFPDSLPDSIHPNVTTRKR